MYPSDVLMVAITTSLMVKWSYIHTLKNKLTHFKDLLIISEKKEFLSNFPQKVQELYDELKVRGVDVIAAYRLENNQCGCCGVDLTTSELDKILQKEFQQCPYCDGVLVWSSTYIAMVPQGLIQVKLL